MDEINNICGGSQSTFEISFEEYNKYENGKKKVCKYCKQKIEPELDPPKASGLRATLPDHDAGMLQYSVKDRIREACGDVFDIYIEDGKNAESDSLVVFRIPAASSINFHKLKDVLKLESVFITENNGSLEIRAEIS